MNRTMWVGAWAVAVGALVGGCGQPAGSDPKVADKPGAEAKPAHDHSGWWCDEHGVPEDGCTMCSAKALKAAKARGDVCEKHPDRAKSQCFLCDPTLKEKYAAKYRAKEGKEPPAVGPDQGGVPEKK